MDSKEDKKEEIIVKGPDFTMSQNFSIGTLILDKLTEHGDKISQVSTNLQIRYKNNKIRLRKFILSKQTKIFCIRFIL